MQCSCGNEARYITIEGELTCGICPIKKCVDSIKLASVPDLLKLCRAYTHTHPATPLTERLREILGPAT